MSSEVLARSSTRSRDERYCSSPSLSLTNFFTVCHSERSEEPAVRMRRPEAQDMYTVPKLTDYSAAALDTASRDLLSALESESAAVNGENEWKLFRDRWLARKDGIAHADQRSLAEGRAERGQARRRSARQRTEEGTEVEAKVEASLTRIRAARSAQRTRRRIASTSPSPAFAVPSARNIPSSSTMNEIVGGVPQSRLLGLRRPGD